MKRMAIAGSILVCATFIPATHASSAPSGCTVVGQATASEVTCSFETPGGPVGIANATVQPWTVYVVRGSTHDPRTVVLVKGNGGIGIKGGDEARPGETVFLTLRTNCPAEACGTVGSITAYSIG